MNDKLPLSRIASSIFLIIEDGTHEIAPDLAYKRMAMVNVVFMESPAAATRNGLGRYRIPELPWG